MPVPVDVCAAQVCGVMGAINAVAESLLVAKTFIYWELAPTCRREFLKKVRQNAKTLAELADDLEREWGVDATQE